MLDLPSNQSPGSDTAGLFIFSCLFWLQICFAEDGGWRSFKGWGQTRGLQFPKWRPVPCCAAWFSSRRAASWPHCPLGHAWKEISGIPAADTQEPGRPSEEPAEPSPPVLKGQNPKFYFIFIWHTRTIAICGVHCEAWIHPGANDHDWVFSELWISAIYLLFLVRLCGYFISSYVETYFIVIVGTLLLFATIGFETFEGCLEMKLVVWISTQVVSDESEKACLSCSWGVMKYYKQ